MRTRFLQEQFGLIARPSRLTRSLDIELHSPSPLPCRASHENAITGAITQRDQYGIQKQKWPVKLVLPTITADTV